ncbi:metallophosphoesterase [Ramlibacter sp.]|uniref:metallophosphoesterase n=1 Tax=Ramlibacter sp. TaxID=1917967 RepID=UPI002D23F765|nr:metallophosphoesterase [Ramlibacter sp.]HYD76599.1 metallophosphoesterase [Ramlibacter sp.]
MKLHVLSDLHLSRGGLELPPTDADVVVLAGDIARPEAAMAWARRIDRPVLYVAGNHEFYGGTLAGTRAQLVAQAADSPIHVLDDSAVELGGVRFLGSTLWSDFRLFGDGQARDDAVAQALRFMRDFQRIHLDEDRQQVFTPLDSAALFERHAAWLDHALAQPFDGPTVVITHHAPSAASVEPRFADSALSACFASNADHLLRGGRAALWIHGHMHHSVDYQLEGTRVICNPRGYANAEGVPENPHFDPGLVVEVPHHARGA